MDETLEVTLLIEEETIARATAERDSRGSLSGLKINFYDAALQLPVKQTFVDSGKIKNSNQLINIFSRIGRYKNSDYEIKIEAKPLY